MSDHQIGLTINGRRHVASVEGRMTLADMLRDDAGYTGVHLGCEHGMCGACTVRLDGRTVRSCLVFAVQCEGSAIETVEGLADGSGADLQQAFVEHNALQCGFCTSGMLITADELLGDNPAPTREEAMGHARGLRAAAPDTPGIFVLGPAEAPLAMVRGRHRMRLLVHGERRSDLQAFIRTMLAAGPKLRGQIRVQVDIDPQSFL